MVWIGIDSKRNLRIRAALAPSESDWDIHDTPRVDVRVNTVNGQRNYLKYL